jgi:hypothetical protein
MIKIISECGELMSSESIFKEKKLDMSLTARSVLNVNYFNLIGN